jgi:hypothetical protein
MRLFKYYLLLILAGLFVGACSKLLDPENDNHDTFARVYIDPAYAEGLLMNAYSKMPTNGFSFNEVATDDAVTNDKLNGYLRMATGQWSAQYNPVSIWSNASSAILYLNIFIPQIDTIKWSWNNENINKMFKARMKGEAYALRGLFRSFLLQNTAGKSTGNKLLGIQLYDEFLKEGGNFNLARAGFTESVDAINADFDKAMQYLPMDFLNITAATQLPPVFSTVNINDYNTVFGIISNQRISKRIVMGLKARVALLAASPAFSMGDQALWIKAANTAADALAGINGIAGLDPNGHVFFQAARVDAVTVAADQKEMLWRGPSNGMSNSLEKTVLPPGLNGNGQINPSQNLVDAFPCKNGYPISNPISGFVASNPYANRDPRLDLYIVRNGLTFKSRVIKTGVGGGVDAKDSIVTSTRTGYYLRKLIREDINFNNDGTNSGTKKHYAVHMRYTELFLTYAEAANEAWGPNGIGTITTYSAKDVIAAIRKRAGITQPDDYLNSITTKEAMRDLIRNERRLELCFEGFRFWDMRRWGLTLTEVAKGVNIDKNNIIYQYVDVESRVYQPYMQYAPIPQQEVLKFSALEQNAGW